MRSSFRKAWDSFNLNVEGIFRKYNAKKAAKIRLKRMNGGFCSLKNYREVVVPYWKKFGVKPNIIWYKIFWNHEHILDPRYIPEDLWGSVIVPYYSNSLFRRFGEDKCMHDIWFYDLKRPVTLLKNIAGIFYNSENQIIDKNTAIQICVSNSNFLIKPSIDSGEGRLISFFDDYVDVSLVEEKFNSLHANFIVQKKVSQHPILSRLNPTSLNTIRIVSFLFEGNVHILSSILRIGAKNAKVDNVGAGGYACIIGENGVLKEEAVNRKSEWVCSTDEGILFKNIKIPAYNEILNIVKQTHPRLAHFKLIGWDFSVNDKSEPVFIEYNTDPGQNQFTCGPTFGDLTDKVLEDVFVKKTLRYSQN